MKSRTKRPPKCCHPNCLECPYSDCIYDRLEEEDYTESNNRDYEMYEAYTGEKLYKPTSKEYQIARQNAHKRKNRVYVDFHEYNQKYYAENKDKIKQNMKEKYDTKKIRLSVGNTEKNMPKNARLMINRIMKRIRKKSKGKLRKDIIKRSWKGQ